MSGRWRRPGWVVPFKSRSLLVFVNKAHSLSPLCRSSAPATCSEREQPWGLQAAELRTRDGFRRSVALPSQITNVRAEILMGIREGSLGLPQECSSREQSGFRAHFAFCSLLHGGSEVHLASRDLCLSVTPRVEGLSSCHLPKSRLWKVALRAAMGSAWLCLSLKDY